jgi:hypothetical protein
MRPACYPGGPLSLDRSLDVRLDPPNGVVLSPIGPRVAQLPLYRLKNPLFSIFRAGGENPRGINLTKGDSASSWTRGDFTIRLNERGGDNLDHSNIPFKGGVPIPNCSAGMFVAHSICKLKSHPILGVDPI